MKRTILFPLFTCLLLIPNGLNKAQSSATDNEMHSLTRKLYSTQIGNTYYSPSIETQQEVRERLLAIAYESPSGRKRVVQALIDLLLATLIASPYPTIASSRWIKDASLSLIAIAKTTIDFDQ